MVCVVDDEVAARVWESILDLRRFLASPVSSEVQCVALVRGGAGWRFEPDPARAGAQEGVLRVPLREDETDSDPRATLPQADASEFLQERFEGGSDPLVGLAGALEPAALNVFRVYLPLLLGGYRARLSGSLFVTAHLAQTLDGRIACLNGQSQWISNEANLCHAHRLRALHDAVVVGARTVETDDPLLTVRNVAGDDPRRVVINASGSVVRSKAAYRVFEGAGATVLCRADVAEELQLQSEAANGTGNVSLLPVGAQDEKLIPPAAVCAALVESGIHSTFVEGGGRTLSHFLDAGLIDVLHLHLAPLILGSGIHGLTLPDVSSVQSGRRMCMEHFDMGGELLLECRNGTAAPEA